MANASALSSLTADPVTLSVGGTDIVLDHATELTDFGGGAILARAYFLGIYDDAGATFTSATLSSDDDIGGFGFNFYIDDITLASSSAVPLPATLLLLSSGLIGLAWRQRRR